MIDQLKSTSKIFFLLFLFICECDLTIAQTTTIDSLENIVKNLRPTDTSAIKVLLDLSYKYKGIDNKKGRLCAERALSIAKVNKNSPDQMLKRSMEALLAIGSYKVFAGEYDEGEKIFLKTDSMNHQAKYKISNGQIQHNLGTIHYLRGDVEAGLKHYLNALKSYEQENYFGKIEKTYNNAGLIYRDLKQYQKAESYLNKAIDASKKNKAVTDLADGYCNLGLVYLDQRFFDKAIANFEKAIPIYKEKNYKAGLSRSFANLGLANEKLKNLAAAVKYDEQALVIQKEIGAPRPIIISLNNLAFCQFLLNDLDRSLTNYREALKLANEIGDRTMVEWITGNISDIYFAKKDYKEAYLYLSRASKYEDTLMNEKITEQVAEMQTKYETEKKEKENIELKGKNEVQQLLIKSETEKRKNQLALSLSFTCLLGIGSIFIYNRRKLKQKAELANELARQEKLRFKAIIEAEEKERARIAQELHDGLGQMLSTARLNVAGLEDSVVKEDKLYLDRSLRIIDDACVEVRNISHNMMPNALIRLGLISAIQELVNNVNSSKLLKIDFTSNVNESLGKSLDITIYRIVQEILNNMIKHAKADHINLEIRRSGANLIINMKDNGIGFDTEELKESKGMGWKNIFSRVSMLNGTIELNSKPQQGTIVYISLELKNG